MPRDRTVDRTSQIQAEPRQTTAAKPGGAPPPVYDQFTAVMRQATGEELDLMAGPGFPDVITGTGLK